MVGINAAKVRISPYHPSLSYFCSKRLSAKKFAVQGKIRSWWKTINVLKNHDVYAPGFNMWQMILSRRKLTNNSSFFHETALAHTVYTCKYSSHFLNKAGIVTAKHKNDVLIGIGVEKLASVESWLWRQEGSVQMIFVHFRWKNSYILLHYHSLISAYACSKTDAWFQKPVLNTLKFDAP